MIGLLDGDIYTYRVAFTTLEETKEVAVARIDEMIQNTLDEIQATGFHIFLSCPSENNFRLRWYPEYKAGRPPKPLHQPFLRQHLIDKWNALVPEDLEADDMLAIYQTEDTIICTIDKDLLQVVGKHYNFVKKEFDEVEHLQGLITFYSQFLIGDNSDNIIGVKGLGPAKSFKILGHLETEQELFNTVRELYNDDERMLMNGICLYMKRAFEDDWKEHFDRLKKGVVRWKA